MKLKFDLPVNLKFLKINQYELEVNKHLKMTVNASPTSAANKAYTRSDQIIVTYGYKGCKYMGKMYKPRNKIVAQDLSGAGDTFFAALAVSITKGDGVEEALTFANDCASVVVSKRGVCTIL